MTDHEITSQGTSPPHRQRAWTAVLVCLVTVWLIAAALRVGWSVYRWTSAAEPTDAGLVFPDERDYWTCATNLAAGQGLVDLDGRRATRMPLYPWLLSPTVDEPNGAWWFRIAQGLFAALVAPLIAVLAWRLGGLRVGWLAGLAAAFDPYLVYFSGLLLTEALFVAALAAFWAVAWPLGIPDGRSRTWRWLAAGLLFVVLVYLRPSVAALLPLWGLCVAVTARRAIGNFAGFVLMALLLAAALTPWALRNQRVLGEPILLTTRTGISLYDGQGPRADGSSNLGFTRDMPAHELGEAEWNRWFRNEALKAMWADPVRVLRLALVKAGRTWDPFPHAAEAQSTGVWLISGAWTLGVVALAIVGLVTWRRHRAVLFYLLLPAIYLTLLHMLFVGSIRYRLPAMPLIEVIAAVGLCGLIGLRWPAWRPKTPATAPGTGDHAPTSWLERQLAPSRYGRKPVPLWRGRLAMAALLALAAGYYGYQHYTSDERIRQQAVAFLERFTGGDVRIDQASFDLFGGVSLRDVTIALPPDVDIDPTANTRRERQVFAAVTLQLQHEPLGLLTGRLDVKSLLADEPTVTIVKNTAHPKYTYNWEALFPPPPKKEKPAKPQMPVIHIRNARVRIVEIRGDQRLAEPEIRLSAMALPDPHRLETYVIPWRKSGERTEDGRLYYNRKAGAYTGELPTLPMTTIKASLPQRYTEWLETLEIAGQIRPDNINYDSKRGSRATIRMHGIKLSVPTSSEERPTTQASKRFLQLTDVAGTLTLTPTESTADFTGKINNTPCQVRAEVTDYAGPLEEAGFDIHIRAEGIVLPDPNDPAGLRFIRSIDKVNAFFEDFDPRGRADIDFTLFKSPGKDMGVLLRGTMTPLGCEASYRRFPYRLRNISGRARFTADGIFIENISGYHGSAFVTVNGYLRAPELQTGFSLDIQAEAVPLDSELFNAIPERFRAVWRQFEPVGLANLTAWVGRPHADSAEDVLPIGTHIDAELIDATACFESFPYRLNHVRGRMVVENDRITVARLTGMHGDAAVRLDGMARYGGAQDERNVEFRLEAADLALDDDLSRAVPEASREQLAELRPQGRVDLVGRVFMPSREQGVAYDVAAHLRDVGVCYRDLPYEVSGLEGVVTIRPDYIVLKGLRGRHGPTTIAIDGRFAQSEQGPQARLGLDCRRLQLDDELLGALPDSLRDRWKTFSPKGVVDLRTDVRWSGQGQQRRTSHETTIEARGIEVCYESLPLPLSEVTGRVRLTDDRLELTDLSGVHNGGRMRLDGQVLLTDPNRRGEIRLQVEGLPLTDTVRAALPDRLGSTWDALQPTGVLDLDLEKLTYQQGPDEPARWTYRGRLGLRDATLKLGFEATQLKGCVRGQGTAVADGSAMTVDGRLELDRVAVNQRVLTDVVGSMVREAGSNRLYLRDLRGKTYDGQAAGYAEIDFSRGRTRYALNMLVHDMSLGPFLNSTREEDQPKTDATGLVDGRLYLAGEAGDPNALRGGGTVRLREAEMYQLPIVLAILSTLNITIPDVNAFNEADARYTLQGSRLMFDRIELWGQSLSMLGSGTMDLDSQEINLLFITGSPHRLPKIPLLTEIAQGASRELMEIAISGPLSEPQLEGRPMRSLRLTLQALLGGGPPEPPPPTP